MKKSHTWDTVEVSILFAKCPYCRKHLEQDNCADAGWEGSVVTCPHCENCFELGKQRD